MTTDEIAALQQRAEQFIHGSTGGPTTILIFDLVAAIEALKEDNDVMREENREAGRAAATLKGERDRAVQMLEVTNTALAQITVGDLTVENVMQLRRAIDPHGALRDIKALIALAEAHRQDSEDVDAAIAEGR